MVTKIKIRYFLYLKLKTTLPLTSTFILYALSLSLKNGSDKP